jgi:membrane protein DedA with SNARE-associated domain
LASLAIRQQRAKLVLPAKIGMDVGAAATMRQGDTRQPMSEWILETINSAGYVGIFLLMLLESVFPPIPSELIIPFAGFAAARGDLNVVLVLFSATLGAVVGALPWYLAGRIFGLERLKWMADRFGRLLTMNGEEIDQANTWFTRFGPAIVLFGRLLPLIRTLISVPAGLVKMGWIPFLLATTIGSLAWNLILVLAGYLLNEHYDQVEGFIDPLTTVVLVIGVGVYLFRLITWKPSSRA